MNDQEKLGPARNEVSGKREKMGTRRERSGKRGNGRTGGRKVDGAMEENEGKCRGLQREGGREGKGETGERRDRE